MKIPRGFIVDGEKLKLGLIQRDFGQSIIEPCLFLHSDGIFNVYVDDCILFA
jgi:hypothetical protein